MDNNSGWPWYAKVAAFFVIAASGYWLYVTVLSPHGFADADIAAAKDYIRTSYSKHDNVTVKDVVLIRDGNTKLTGFVKLEAFGIEVTKPCSALMSSEDSQYIVKCE